MQLIVLVYVMIYVHFIIDESEDIVEYVGLLCLNLEILSSLEEWLELQVPPKYIK